MPGQLLYTVAIFGLALAIVASVGAGDDLYAQLRHRYRRARLTKQLDRRPGELTKRR